MQTLPWKIEFKATFALAWPLIIAQLAQIALFTTDVVMMGWLGPQHLAAGMLATSILHPLMLFGTGILSAISPMIAQALGAKQIKPIRRSVRQGLWGAIMLSLIFIPVLLNIQPLLIALGQKEELGVLARDFMLTASWSFLPALLMVVLRSTFAAHGNNRVILWITLAGFALNILSNYALMFGNWGFPRLELLGSGISTSLTNFVMFGACVGYTFHHRRFRRYHLWVRFFKPDWPRFRAIFKLGFPIGCMMIAETGLFSTAVIMMGWLGSNELAGHAVAIQCASIAFMIPLGLSFATTIRVGRTYGARNPQAVAIAGWTSYIICLGFAFCTSAILWLLPETLVSFYLDKSNPANQVPIELAISFLAVAALFQLVDATQVIGAAILRGMSDTAKPLLVAVFGYWVIGMPIAYILAFKLGFGGLGIWYGLAAGLAVVAVILLIRFMGREKFGVYKHL